MKVKNSRFIATAAPVFSVDGAKAFLASVREEFSDASHHVPAFQIGHGASVIAHCSDDGEPAGTAGRPALAVLQGSGLGDTIVVVTRYFGGTKLGTGGLVRAYGDAVRQVLDILPRAEKVPVHTVMTVLGYPWYDQVTRLVAEWNGQIIEEEFAAEITILSQFTVEQFSGFQEALRELSHGTLESEILETNRNAIMPIKRSEKHRKGE